MFRHSMPEEDISWSYVYKLITLGDGGVGKSSLLTRFVTETFDPNIRATLGCDHFSLVRQVSGERVKVTLWDLSGAFRFRSVTRMYFRGAAGAVVVYDVTDAETFGSVLRWVDEVRQHASADAIIMLVGNKTDLEARRVVSRESAAEFARAQHLMFMETSALADTNVTEAFSRLIAQIHRGRINSIDQHSRAATAALAAPHDAHLVDLTAPPPAPTRTLVGRLRDCCNIQ